MEPEKISYFYCDSCHEYKPHTPQLRKDNWRNYECCLFPKCVATVCLWCVENGKIRCSYHTNPPSEPILYGYLSSDEEEGQDKLERTLRRAANFFKLASVPELIPDKKNE